MKILSSTASCGGRCIPNPPGAMAHSVDSLVIAGLDPRLSGTLIASQGELQLRGRWQAETGLPPLDSADEGFDLEAMEESMSDACEETCRGLLRLCGIVEQLQKQICNDGGGDLQPNGIGRASVETADFQVLLDPSEEQLDLPAGLVEIGDGLGRAVEVVGEQCELLAGFDGDDNHPAVLGEGIFSACGQALGQTNDLVADDVGTNGDRPLRDDRDRSVFLEAGHETAALGVEIGAQKPKS